MGLWARHSTNTMAPITITIRVGTSDTFPLELDDEETVEALAVMVMSLKPELGEEDLPRLVFKGKVLKEEGVVLRDLELKNGDFIVAAPAKRAAGTSAPPAPAAEPTTTGGTTAGTAIAS